MRKWIFIDEHGNRTPMNEQGQFDDPKIEAVRVMSAGLDKEGIPQDEDAECYIMRHPPEHVEVALLALYALQQLRDIDKRREAANRANLN